MANQSDSPMPVPLVLLVLAVITLLFCALTLYDAVTWPG